MPGSAPATDKDEGSRQGNFGAQSHSVRSRCLRFAVTVARPHARLASRLLARLCRTGLVTRRVSTKGFTFEMILLSRASWRNVENYSLVLNGCTIDQQFMEAKSARFKAECSLLHIRMFVGTAAGHES
jgi:hypothetical protein